MAGLALLLSIRFPYPEATNWFRITIALLVACASAVAPLLVSGSLALLWIPLAAFIIATLAFLTFSVKIIRAHYERLKR